MARRSRTPLVALSVAAAVVSGALVLAPGSAGAAPLTLQNAVTGKLGPATLPVIVDGRQVGVRRLPFLSSGLLTAAGQPARAGVSASDDRLQAADGAVQGTLSKADVGIGQGTLGCERRNPDGNVRVNQDCTFRRQAENDIAVNPSNPDNLLAGQNDSRVGYNQCGIDYSRNGGQNWGDLLPPERQKVNLPSGQEPTADDPNRHTLRGGDGTLHTYDAFSDPALAFDSQGRGFFSCIGFDVASNASILYVTTSPRGAQGSFFYNLDATDRRFVVVEDNSAEVFHDKNFVTADTHPGSPNRDNVYVTWTVFRFSAKCAGGTAQAPAYCESNIFGSMSTDHGFTWSTPEKISGRSADLCFQGDALDPLANPHACNFNQGSDPVTLPNGDLQVVFNNGNTARSNPNGQQLGVHCAPRGSSPAGSARLNCATPTKVGDDIFAGSPTCDFGRGPEQCIPGTFVRTNDFPRIQNNSPDGTLSVVWQDYRNREWDIQLARSTDGGRTWSPSRTVNRDRGVDHYFAAVDAGPNDSGRVGVSYYRTERVPNENTSPADGFTPGRDPGVQQGLSDYALAGGRGLDTPYSYRVVSPTFAPPDGVQAGFLGDYTGLVLAPGPVAHPIWSDTRNIDPFAPVNGLLRDEDAFTVATGLPDGVRSAETVTSLRR